MAGKIDYLPKPKAAPKKPAYDSFDDPALFTTSKADKKRSLKSVKGSDDLAAEAFKMGRDEARAEAKAKKAATPYKRKSGPSQTKKAVKRAARPVVRGVRQGVRQAEQPIVTGIAGSVRVSAMVFLVLALYLFLENTVYLVGGTDNAGRKVPGVLPGFARALDWLRAPDKSVPYVQKQG